MTTTKFNPISRLELKSISKQIKPFAQMAGLTVNEFLLNLYSSEVKKVTGEKPKNWKTFKQWKDEGKKIIKGSKAFKIWSAPKSVKKKGQKEDDKETAFFTCNLFCEFQVQ